MKPKVAWLTVAILFGLNFVQSQQVREQPRHPGEVLRFEVKFDGQDTPKIKIVRLMLRARAAAPPNQTGFFDAIAGTAVRATSPNTFYPEIRIPDNAAAGEYYLDVEVVAEGTAGNSAGRATYTSGKDFQLHDFHIDNPRTFTPPHITVKVQP